MKKHMSAALLLALALAAGTMAAQPAPFNDMGGAIHASRRRAPVRRHGGRPWGAGEAVCVAVTHGTASSRNCAVAGK